ncbi:helicase C-terminal domain-containing protein [candidate division KSB1 bacterium]
MTERKVSEIFSRELKKEIELEIDGNSGNEVFFRARTGKNGEIISLNAVAWGNEIATPALLNDLEPGDIVIHNHPSGNLIPSNADIQIASHLGNQGVGFYIINNDASALKIVVDRYLSPKLEYINADEIAAALGDDSAIALNLPEYESRPGQVGMASAVARCFNDGKIGLIEAGTGTGKTLAYLLPAIDWAVRNKERVLVSTNTINLQEQLIFKDLPFLNGVLDAEFKAVLVKGRANYACLRKIDAEERDLGHNLFEPNDEDLKTLKSLFSWSKKTADGSLSDLTFIPKQDIWDRIKCESDTCTGLRCSFYEDCFLVNARREAALADIVIVNHHLLFADLSLRGSMGALADIAVLPPYTRVIIDEAHHIETVCTEYFGTQVSRTGIKRLLGRLVSETRKGELKGLFPRAAARLRSITSKGSQEKITAVIQKTGTQLIEGKNGLSLFCDDVFDDIAAFVKKQTGNNGDERQVLITDTMLEDKEWSNIIEVKVRALIQRLREFKTLVRDLAESLKGLDKRDREGFDNIIIELDAHVMRLGQAADSFYYLVFEPDDTIVKWIELSDKSPAVKICGAPIEVAEPLKLTLFTPYDTVVMTSATLTVGGSFDFIRSRLGLDRIEQNRTVNRMLPSPFDFKRQAAIGIPLDNHPPDHPEHAHIAHSFIIESLSISKGRSFVLYTSYTAMRGAFERISSHTWDIPITILIQGTDTRHNLINRFKKEQPAVLFGTDSFWEGVDVIGDALESIIITRLPFRVPTVPIEIARREAIDRAGGNSFLDYTVPQAVIKFKQGFGRLIRHKNDRGTILILDNRIMSKKYGRIFLESLPECTVTADYSDRVFRVFEEFYAD